MKQTKTNKRLALKKQTVSVLKSKEMAHLKGGLIEPGYCGTNQGCMSNYTACGGSCFAECPYSLPSNGPVEC
jgi:hypothetical protein